MECSVENCICNCIDTTNNDCKCILHCKKDNWNDAEKQNIEEFWKNMQQEIENIDLQIERLSEEDNECQLENYLDEPKKYENIIFPKFQDFQINKSNNFTVISKLDYETLVTVFQLKKVEFINCHFLDTADFSKYHFLKYVKFNNCHFHKGILLTILYKNHLDFNDCKFYDNDINLSNKTFESSLFFKDCKNIGEINLSNTAIIGFASFKGSTIRKANFEKVSFKNLAVFVGATFQSDVDFIYTKFNEQVYFQDITIKGKLNLKTAIFKDEVNFLGIKKDNNNSIDVANRETARIIKHSFEKINNTIEANKFYALEMKEREKELSTLEEKNWTDFIVFKLHKISSNHSQDWLLVLLWIINLTFVYSAFKIESCVNEQWLYIYSLGTIGLIITLIECFALLEIPKSHKGMFFLVFIIINWLLYGLLTNDYKLCYASNDFNPFSLMTGKENLTFTILIYKSVIAYLIYQFIISIRQNTRRK
ncbi:MAG: pentapeptide repeat-containing protein [Sulfurimonadaceae bacterium]|jgi:uncharacterized protein YjbI with pentapeptide repeats|nr:pentapeptide repeat-containing protein [Sulfurimonadaceae bacterium]